MPKFQVNEFVWPISWDRSLVKGHLCLITEILPKIDVQFYVVSTVDFLGPDMPVAVWVYSEDQLQHDFWLLDEITGTLQ